MSTAGASDQGFFTFYREYTHTGIHAASTAGLTAFGLLSFVHRAFVVLAIAVYVLPPIYLYLTRDDAVETVEPSESDGPVGSETTDPSGPAGSASASEPVDPSARANEQTDSTGSVDRVEATESSDATATVASGSPNDRSRASAATEGNETAGSVTTSEGVGRTDERESERAPQAEVEQPKGTSTDETADERIEASDEDGSKEIETSADSEDGGIEVSDDGEGADVNAGVEPAESSSPTPTAAGDERSGAEGSDSQTEEGTTDEPTTLEWTEVDSPTDETLSDVVATDAGAYAVGTGGVVLAREDGWETVLDHGPSAESNALRGVDATDDGNAIWFTGDSGTLARYDAEEGRHTDHSAPAGITDNWVDVAVAGPAGEEGVHLVNGSGQVLAGEFDGSEAEWAEAIKPGSGSSMSAIEFIEGGIGYCCDTNSGVYETTDGREFERIGVEDGGSFTALAAAGPEALAVAAADGTVQRYDGSVWTPLHAAEVALDALSTDGSTWFAVGDGGTIRELVDGSWEPRETPVETNLHGVAADEPSVAVGAEGTILELRPVDGDG